jgi:hypothetical protein
MIKGEKYEPEKDHVRAEKKDASKNVYKKRIDAIIKANDDNAAINWMVSDIYSGDVVTKLYDDYFDEKEKEDAAIQKEIAKEFENQQPDMVNPSVVKDKSKLAENKRRYEENKLRAKEAYSRRKTKFRKSRRNRAYAMDPITALLSIASGPLFDVANNLIKSTQIGYYKFQNFWNDIKAIAEEEDKPSLLSAAKIYYINKFFNSCTEEKENMDLPLTVQLYKEDGVPAVGFNGTALGQTVRRILADKQRNTIISSYHVTIAKENGKLKPFYNQYALQTMINNLDKKRLLRETKKAIIEGNMTADQIIEFYDNNYFEKYFNENVTEA